MPEIRYLTPAEIYEIAEKTLGRKPDVRDRHLLRSAAARPMLAAFGAEAYPTLFDKAAALLHALAAHHLFFDGNKRTATRAVTTFLHHNGWTPTWDTVDMAAFVLEIAQNHHDIPEIAAWLEEHTILTPVRYLTVDELIYINERLTADTPIHTIVDGKRKVRAMDLLEAAWGRPMQTVFGEDAYPTLEDKAAALLHSLVRNHPFADGNKRTATVALIFMLAVNGKQVKWEAAEALRLILALAEGKREVHELVDWLKTESGPSRLEPDAEADMALLDTIMAEHRWLINQLAGQ